MRNENTLPNPFTFAGVFTAVVNVYEGKQAHCVAIKTGNCGDVFVGSSLLNMYCKVGLVFEGRKVFDKMPERNSVSWSSMISGYAVERRGVEAVELFKIMRREEREESEFVFTSVLSSFVDNEFVDVSKQIHCLAVKNGLLSFVAVGNALVTMYAKCGNLEEALRTFELLGEKNSVTWSAMITGYAQGGDSDKALRLFSEMQFSGLTPSKFTLVGVLNACSNASAIVEGKQVHDYILKLGFESQVFIRTALVDMYAKCGCTCDARKGFDQLHEADTVLWSSMIAGYVQNGENEEALGLYRRMEMEGILPNEVTMASILKACSSLAALEQGKQIHARTIKYGFGLELPIGSALSSMYTKCGNLDDGSFVFRTMPGRDVISWNSMISGLSQNGRGMEALELFEEMRLSGTIPDHVTFVNLLSACSHMGFVETGQGYFKLMVDDYGLDPKVDHYACMVDLLSRAGQLHEAKAFIESVPIDHGLCLWRILLESSAYVLLSSIYSSMGRWEDVQRVRSIMKRKRVSKEPGCSWIDIKNQLHVFVVGDQLHPQIKEIRAEVKRLTKEMKEEGYRPVTDSSFHNLSDVR
ncbi:hypothetical protein IFM89_021721 [Coptis chinensis]|uniref:Pentatricopeptide repeat-containing protein n=1 Tax=Coptis chinensis TaxID=261450 RepID=A0A835HNL3_9MAGN|nr:hypothetical protein IFM89_021721 [Coptis chinensis]